MRNSLLLALALSSSAAAQVATEDFEVTNTDDWGVEFNPALVGVHMTTGGNPGGRIEVTVQNSASQLPAAMVVPGAVNQPWKGDFRGLGVTSFTFDRQVEVGSSNFGTRPFLVIANDGGTRTDFADDAWAFVYTGDLFQFGSSPWTTVSTPIPSSSTTTPAGWDLAALPGSPLGGLSGDALWNAIIQDVDYIGIAMDRPFGGAFWFGNHIISFDNFILDGVGSIGTRYCSPGSANSTGAPSSVEVTGSASVSQNNLALVAGDLPLNAFGFFLTSQAQGFVANPGGSQGNLCLGGSIGRYVGPGQILSSGAVGAFTLALDLTQTPTPTGLVAIAAGETWNFQAWHRDAVGGVATSNFTDGISVQFQ